MRRAFGATAAAVVAALVLAGCGADTDPGDDGGHSGHGDAVEVEIQGDQVEPNGRRVEAQVGEPVGVHIESDRAGELHVHSTPEQTIPFEQGESTVEIVVDTPGVIDVEEHEAGVVVLQLEVR